MADIKWIKLDVGMPDNRKIKRIRKLPDGNNIILFWVFLLARAGETNQRGALFFTDVHHLNGSTVGMGNDRSKVSHIGRRVVCLCRECHGKIHQGGEQAFFNKHHIAPIKLTEETVKLLNL